MSCNCCKSYGNNNCERNCSPCNNYCTPCYPIYSPVTQYYSDKFHRLEHNYPVNKCLCNNFGTNPRYYNKPHIPCNCSKKCYPC